VTCDYLEIKGQGQQAAQSCDRKSLVCSEWEGLQTSNLVYGWSTMTRITDVCGDLQAESFG